MASGERIPQSILFMCRMNAVRSPMAEALAKRMLPSATFIASAGVRTGERDPFVDAVLAEDGLSLAHHHSKTMDEMEDDYFDLIITLAPEAHHAAIELTRSAAVTVEYWPTPDPTATHGTRDQIMASYRDVRERLKARIAARFLSATAGKAD